MTNKLYLLLILVSCFQSAFATDWVCKVVGGQEEPYKLEITRVPSSAKKYWYPNVEEIVYKLTKKHTLQFDKGRLKEVVPLLFSFLEIANKKFVKNGYLKAYEYVLKYCQNGTIIISHVCTSEKKENAKCHVLPKSKEELFSLLSSENSRFFPLLYLCIMGWFLCAVASVSVLICYIIKAIVEANLSKNGFPISLCLHIIFSIPSVWYLVIKGLERYENRVNNEKELSIEKEKILALKRLINEKLLPEKQGPVFIKSSFSERTKDLFAMMQIVEDNTPRQKTS